MSLFVSTEPCPVDGEPLIYEIDHMDHIVLYERSHCPVCGFERGTETGSYWGVINGERYEWSWNEENSPSEKEFYSKCVEARAKLLSRDSRPVGE